MAVHTWRAVLLSAAVGLSGCSFATESLWPSLTGADPEPAAETIVIAESAAERGEAPVLVPTTPPPQLGTTDFAAVTVTPAQSTGTFVGQKVAQLRGELATLQARITQRNGQLQLIRTSAVQNSQRYHGTVAAISTRLQIGTTPGNPVLVRQWNAAQSELDRIGADIASMNSLANEVAGDSAMAAFVLESTRATFGLSGAIDEDHRQLSILEDETNRTVVLIDRLLNELSEDVSRQTAYVGNERSSLTTLSLSIQNGELFGPSLASRAFASAAPLASRPPPAPGDSFAVANRRPLVVIRFDRPDVPYEQALYSAVARALERRPDSQFDLVAVSPARGGSAEQALDRSNSRKYAEDVLRTLTEMGLPAQRVAMSAATSAEAATTEVHIYVR